MSFKEHLVDFSVPTGSTLLQVFAAHNMQLWGNIPLDPAQREEAPTASAECILGRHLQALGEIGLVLGEDRGLQLCPDSLFSYLRFIRQSFTCWACVNSTAKVSTQPHPPTSVSEEQFLQEAGQKMFSGGHSTATGCRQQ